MSNILQRIEIKKIIDKYADYNYLRQISTLNKSYYNMYLYHLQEYKVILDTIKKLSVPNLQNHYPYWIVLSVNDEYKKVFGNQLTNPNVIKFFLNILNKEYSMGFCNNAYYLQTNRYPFIGIEIDPRYYFGWDGLSNNWIKDKYNEYFTKLYFNNIYNNILQIREKYSDLPLVIYMNTRIESNPSREYIKPFIQMFVDYARVEGYDNYFQQGNQIYTDFSNLFQEILTEEINKMTKSE